MDWIYWNVSEKRTAELRYSNTAVDFQCLTPEKDGQKPDEQRIFPRAHAGGIRPPAYTHLRAPLRAHSKGERDAIFIVTPSG